MSETTNMQVVPEMAAAEEKKEYTLRELQARDVFTMSRIIGSIGIDQFKYAFSADFLNSITPDSTGGEKDIAATVGVEMFFEIAGIIVNGIPKCEKDVYAFVSDLTGIVPVEMVKALPMNTFFNIVIDIVKKDEFKDFIGVVSKLFK